MRVSTSTIRMIVVGALVVVMLGITAYFWVTKPKGEDATAQPSGSQSPTSMPPSPTATTSELATSCEAIDPALANQVSSFIEAINLIKPDDTEATRLQRVTALRPAVPDKILNELDLSLSTGTTADDYRIMSKFVMQAAVNPCNMFYEQFAADDPDTVEVNAAYVVEQHWPDGRVEQGQVAYFNATWYRSGATWHIVEFDESE